MFAPFMNGALLFVENLVRYFPIGRKFYMIRSKYTENKHKSSFVYHFFLQTGGPNSRSDVSSEVFAKKKLSRSPGHGSGSSFYRSEVRFINWGGTAIDAVPPFSVAGGQCTKLHRP